VQLWKIFRQAEARYTRGARFATDIDEKDQKDTRGTSFEYENELHKLGQLKTRPGDKLLMIAWTAANPLSKVKLQSRSARLG